MSRCPQINSTYKRFCDSNSPKHQYRKHDSIQRTDRMTSSTEVLMEAYLSSRLLLSILHGHKPLLLVSGSTRDQGRRQTRPMAQLTSWSIWHSRYMKKDVCPSICELNTVHRVPRIEHNTNWSLRLKTWEAT